MLIAAELVAITHMFKFEYPPELLAQAGKFFYHEKTATKLIFLRLPKFNAVLRSKCVSWDSDYDLHPIHIAIQSCSCKTVWPNGVHLWNNEDAICLRDDCPQHYHPRLEPCW